MSGFPKFYFSLSPALDSVLAHDNSIQRTDASSSKIALIKLESTWAQYGNPLLNHMVQSLDCPFKRKEVDIVFSKHVARTVFHPVIIRLDLENLTEKALKNAFLLTLQAAAHIWGHDNWSEEVQEKLNAFDFSSAIARNHVAYFSILYRTYEAYFPEGLNEKLKMGNLSSVWNFVEKIAPEVLIKEIYGKSLRPIEVDHSVRENLRNFFEL